MLRLTWLGGKSLGVGDRNTQSEAQKAAGWLIPRDQTARLGFTFANSDDGSPDTVSASTLVGSGRFYAEATFGWPIGFLSVCHDDAQYSGFNHTVNIELRGGWVTDPDQHQLHSHYMLGLASVWGFFGSDAPRAEQRRVELLMGLDFGISEFPAIDSVINNGTENRTTVRLEGSDLRYSRQGAIGLRAEINVPIADTGYLVISGRAFDTLSRPYNEAEWNLMVGFAVPFGFFTK